MDSGNDDGADDGKTLVELLRDVKQQTSVVLRHRTELADAELLLERLTDACHKSIITLMDAPNHLKSTHSTPKPRTVSQQSQGSASSRTAAGRSGGKTKDSASAAKPTIPSGVTSSSKGVEAPAATPTLSKPRDTEDLQGIHSNPYQAMIQQRETTKSKRQEFNQASDRAMRLWTLVLRFQPETIAQQMQDRPESPDAHSSVGPEPGMPQVVVEYHSCAGTVNYLQERLDDIEWEHPDIRAWYYQHDLAGQSQSTNTKAVMDIKRLYADTVCERESELENLADCERRCGIAGLNPEDFRIDQTLYEEDDASPSPSAHPPPPPSSSPPVSARS